MNAASLLRSANVTTLLFTLCGPGFAGDNAQDNRETAERTDFKLPSFDAMLSSAMSHNPDIRAADSQVDVAQAEAERVRLQVAQAIREFRDEWNAELAALAEAEAEIQDAERTASLPEGAIATRIILQSERLVETSRQRVELAKNRLREMQQVLPLLLGTTDDDNLATRERPVSAESSDASPKALDDVLRQRLDVLTQIAELQRSAYQNGDAGFDAASAAQADLLGARLELAQGGAERIEIRRELLEVASQLENVAEELSRALEGTTVDALKARAFRLRCEADLLREQSGQ